jgi:hypothetical protein
MTSLRPSLIFDVQRYTIAKVGRTDPPVYVSNKGGSALTNIHTQSSGHLPFYPLLKFVNTRESIHIFLQVGATYVAN